MSLARNRSRHEWTFGEILDVSCRFAGSLRERGVGKGDTVLTYMGNSPEWVFTLVACWRIGAWLSGESRADVDNSGTLTAHDVLEFIGVWFAGCGS